MVRSLLLSTLLLGSNRSVLVGAFLGAAALALVRLERGRRRAARESAGQRGRSDGTLEGAHARSGVVPVCVHCRRIRDDEGLWRRVEESMGARTGAAFSHGICPDCLDEHYEGVPGPVRSERSTSPRP